MKNPALLEEIKTYKGRDEVPEDFDAFWDQALANLAELPEYKLEEQDFSIPNVVCYELTFKGTRDGLVYARVVFPKTDQKIPVIFHFHGYMGRCWDWTDMLAYTVTGYGVVSMDVRGQSGYSTDGDRSPLGNTVKGQIIRGAVLRSLSRWSPGSGCCWIESSYTTNGSHLSILIGFQTCIRDWKHQRGL